MRRSFIALLSLVTLGFAACNQSATMRPRATQAELERERQIQSTIAKQYADADKPITAAHRADLTARLQDVVRKVAPAAVGLCYELYGPKARRCVYPVEMAPKGSELNAYADGDKVVLFPGMVKFAHKDAHLAFIVAHELAHNIMRHPDAAQENVAVGAIVGALADAFAASQGYDTQGQFMQTGAQTGMLRYSSDFEEEADYIALYILARAGVNISEAPQFWRMMSAANPDSIYVSTTHPSNPERFIAMEKVIREIELKRQKKLPLLPEFKPAKTSQHMHPTYEGARHHG